MDLNLARDRIRRKDLEWKLKHTLDTTTSVLQRYFLHAPNEFSSLSAHLSVLILWNSPTSELFLDCGNKNHHRPQTLTMIWPAVIGTHVGYYDIGSPTVFPPPPARVLQPLIPCVPNKAEILTSSDKGKHTLDTTTSVLHEYFLHLPNECSSLAAHLSVWILWNYPTSELMCLSWFWE